MDIKIIRNLPDDLRIYIYIIYCKKVIVRNLEKWFYYKHRMLKNFIPIKGFIEDMGFDINSFEVYSNIRYEWRHCSNDWISMIDSEDSFCTIKLINMELSEGLWGCKAPII